MKKLYYPTLLEQWVSKFYFRFDIFSPEDIDERKICRALGIYLIYKESPCMSYEHGRFKSITIDTRLSKEIQRERFYHELCHILRHAGRQMMMPAAFRELQESDASNFARYGAIPYHMLKFFDLKDSEIVFIMSNRLKISEELCKERLEKIKNNMRYKKVIS